MGTRFGLKNRLHNINKQYIIFWLRISENSQFQAPASTVPCRSPFADGFFSIWDIVHMKSGCHLKMVFFLKMFFNWEWGDKGQIITIFHFVFTFLVNKSYRFTSKLSKICKYKQENTGWLKHNFSQNETLMRRMLHVWCALNEECFSRTSKSTGLLNISIISVLWILIIYVVLVQQ